MAHFHFAKWRSQSKCAIFCHSMSRLAQIGSILGLDLGWSQAESALARADLPNPWDKCCQSEPDPDLRSNFCIHIHPLPPSPLKLLTNTHTHACPILRAKFSALSGHGDYYWILLANFSIHHLPCSPLTRANSITCLFLALLDPKPSAHVRLTSV